MSFSFYYVRKKTAITDKHCLQNVLILLVWDDVNPVFDHSPKAIFQIYLHYKTVWWKMLCCALITDYYNPMNKHLSCQHPQYELLPRDCDAIWISPHAIFHVKKSVSHVLIIKCEKSCSGHSAGHGIWRGHNLTTTSWLYKSIFACHPPLFFFFSFHMCPVIHNLQLLSKGKNTKILI